MTARTSSVRRNSMDIVKRLVLGMLVLLAVAGRAYTAYAIEAGAYTVTVTPNYRDPETGTIEDPGNNEAIGQGMTRKLCAPRGLLEVEPSGEMYLTVRYYLSQFVSDVSFEERAAGVYTERSASKMQVVAPVEGAENIDIKYGFTDWRFKISSLSSVIRGKAYIEPMGRSVVYFFTYADPVAGNTDFITSSGVAVAEQALPDTGRAGSAALQGDFTEGVSEYAPEISRDTTDYYVEANGREGMDEGYFEASPVSGLYDEGGSEYTPVTGIPKKGKSTADDTHGDVGEYYDGAVRSEYTDSLRLSTDYDLSKADLKRARRLTGPILDSAVGITNIADVIDSASMDSQGGAESNAEPGNNLIMMYVLLGICAAVSAVYIFKAAGRRTHASGG